MMLLVRYFIETILECVQLSREVSEPVDYVYQDCWKQMYCQAMVTYVKPSY